MRADTTAQGVADTKMASRYLQQLCKHWSHKAETAFDAEKGTIVFESGESVSLKAAFDQLHVEVTTKDSAGLDPFCKVVAEHLERFGFREDFSVTWQTV
ncbi:DUF2218 domain-containing protein [Lentibacter algarum]|uniref:DUF2218 domain-containing protein n=1 Tax=Lentibacter algarum TaxID=576131 RepID=UPI001C0867D0|nr:DUF2218 domain-containing protein [Lentibacter algarum]MBU2983704.1 DUF2218 domain-containing protein [Lentibacter algarum]